MPSDYTRIERAIGYLCAHYREQPELPALAARAGLGQHHFQRLFSRWAGISPKKFLQHLTLADAKRRLIADASVLDAAYDSGLSGPGRLHDLFVTQEALTPGEFKRKGTGLAIRYGFHDSPFGEALVMATARGICGIAFVQASGRKAALDDLTARWPGATFARDQIGTEALAKSAFVPERRGAKPLTLHLRGTPFQIKVWEALLRVPYGALVTYEHLAREVCSAKAARAVGAAVGANPIAWLIPCHRVIRKHGVAADWLGGYHWGPARKMAMLGFEAARADKDGVVL